MIINAASIAALNVGWRASFQGAFDGTVTSAQRFSTGVTSTTRSNTYPWLGSLPGFREWVGDRVVQNVSTNSYEIVNKEFEATVGVAAKDIKDDMIGIYTPMFAGLGTEARQHPDTLTYALLKAGASTECYDGKNFFATNHPILKGTSTASNYDATGGGAMWILLDTRKMLQAIIRQDREAYGFQSFTSMTDESVFRTNNFLYGSSGRTGVGFGLWQVAYASLNTLNSTNFEAARAAMMALKNDAGKSLGIRPNLCLVSTGKLASAEAVFSAATTASGAGNVHYKECEIIHSAELD